MKQRGDVIDHLVEVKGKNASEFAEALAAGGQHSSTHSVSSVSYIGVIETSACPLLGALSGTSCFLIKEVAEENYITWDVIGESVADINSLVKRLRASKGDVKIVRSEKINGGRRLTERQEQILRLAFDSGYFESPHKASVRQLAKVLDCSPSTLIRLLRKAEKKALAEKFGTKG